MLFLSGLEWQENQPHWLKGKLGRQKISAQVLFEEILVEPLNVLLCLGHLRKSLEVHSLVNILGKPEPVLALGKEPAPLLVVLG